MIYTSYFGQLDALRRNGIEPIAISRSVPKNFSGKRILALAPTWNMLNMDDEDYDRCYERILDGIDRKKFAESFKGKDVALLCWEKDDKDCHRSKVASWLREGGYEAKEFEEMEQLSLF